MIHHLARTREQKKRNAYICRVLQLKQAQLKSEKKVDGHSPLLTALHIFGCSYLYIHIIPAIACFLHFVTTEDSVKTRSSLGSKCNASQRMESMTDDHEGIFVDSMRRTDQ